MMRLSMVLVWVMAVSSTAAAEPKREGFMIGASLGGGGANSCRECSAGGGPFAELHVGWWLRRDLGLSYEAWAFLNGTDPLQEMNAHGLGLATVTTRIRSRWWLKGGIGLALYQQSNPLEDELTGMDTNVELRGLGLGAGVGYELYQSRGAFVVEASGRLGGSLFADHGAGAAGAVGIGVTWN
jgi:hypothetical protein